MSIAIQTKFVGPTNSRGAHVRAFTLDKNPGTGKADRVSSAWDHALSVHDNHRCAARKLAELMGWGGQWAYGDTTDGGVWVRVLDETLGFKAEA